MKKNYIFILVLFLVLIFLFFFYFKEKKEANFFYFDFNNNNLKLLISDKSEEWTRGLSGIYQLENYDGMIFIFPKKEIKTFWNKETYLDLVLIWLGKDEEIIGMDYLPSIEKTKSILAITSPSLTNKVIEYVVKEKDEIFIFQPLFNSKIASPLKIRGIARGFWFFEAEFLAELYDSEQNFLGLAILTAKEEWMTEDFVPFEGSLIFSQPETFSGTLMFLNSNPSGLPENQKIFEMPVRFD